MTMTAPPTLSKDLVLVGGGHAHALVLRMWGMRPMPGVRVTLINPGPTAPYTGMLPGHIAGHYTRQALDIDLVQLAWFAGARIIMAPAIAVDAAKQTVSVRGRGEIAYDVASLDVGLHGQIPDITGFATHGTAAKPLDRYAVRWAGFLKDVAAGRAAPRVAVIGGGIAGCELALAMAHGLRAANVAARVTVIEASDQLGNGTTGADPQLRAAMAQLQVQVVCEAAVQEVTESHVILKNGHQIPARLTVGAAGGFAHPWLTRSNLPTSDAGFVSVEETLMVAGHPNLFAVGDCADMAASPRPKAGVFAVRAAPVLHRNLRARLTGQRLKPFRPQKDYLKLISLGRKSALAAKWGRCLDVPGLWRWKDSIDQRFMRKFTVLPQMAPPKIKGPIAEGADPQQMLCGGCGAKVAPETLRAALDVLPKSTRPDVLSGPGDDAAVLQVGDQVQVITADHLRGFNEDLGLVARIASLHALGDIWAMGAAPQAALLSVTLPRMSEALQARSMSEILAAVGDVMQDCGAEVVGGHSTMGAELSIGLTLTGLASKSPITHAGAKPGDALILTRAIGSGTLLAAEMQGRANGSDIADLLEVLQRPQGDAADILNAAHAMTDVTGFGLAGHLMALCRASCVQVEVDLAAVPFFTGAVALATKGVRSTIHEANALAAPVFGPDSAQKTLLHDPQTAGGLLAAVDVGVAQAVVEALNHAGHQAAIIGRVDAGDAAITVR